MKSAIIAVVCLVATACFALPVPNDRPWRADLLNVHIVAHTHDDVGWLKTVDEYYMGANNSIQDAGVQYILDSVIVALDQNPDRKFIYVEIAFFKRWWDQQTPAMQEKVRGFVASGQLEFINGGWCMNDEAATHYVAIIDQMALGHDFIKENFNKAPTIGWHIDPFGHANTQASLFALMGFNGFFFGRIDYADRAKRLNESNMEMLWRASPNLGDDGAIWAGVLRYGYGPPDGFNWDTGSGDAPIQDDQRLEDYNVQSRVNDFVGQVLDQAKQYRTNNIILTMGSDFQYSNANTWFKNLDKLIKYVNADGRVNAFYSTPSLYLQAKYEANLTWSVKTDDFFPYADNPHGYWTGYFTSRVAVKGYVRKCSGFLQVCKNLELLTGGFPNAPGSSSTTLREAMGVAQHHDAVSGTEKQHVAYDYARRLAKGETECEGVTANALANLVTKSGGEKPAFSRCRELNVSLCDASTTGKDFVVTVFNPLGYAVHDTPIRVPVKAHSVTVLGPDGNPVAQQEMIPLPKIVPHYEGQVVATKAVLFIAPEIPAFGYSTFFITQSSDARRASETKVKSKAGGPAADITITGGLSVVFDGVTGRLKRLGNVNSKISTEIDQTFMWYNSSTGTTYRGDGEDQHSGAYIFRPNRTDPFIVSPTGGANTTLTFSGALMSEVTQVFAPWVSQQVRVFANIPIAEVEMIIGPIPINDRNGKEVITRFISDLDTRQAFATDSNGREWQSRLIDHRDTWQLNKTEPVSENYYPVNAAIRIGDSNKTRILTILTDRSCGGASLDNGQVEVMVHRRLLSDDSRGVGEPLNETGIFGDGLTVRIRHLISFEPQSTAARVHRLNALSMSHPLELFFAPLTSTVQNYLSTHTTNQSFLKTALPPNVHLLTLEALSANHGRLRLEHIFEQNEDADYSKPATIDLSTLFDPSIINLSSVSEMSLSGNMNASNVNRYHWRGQTEGRKIAKIQDPPGSVTLNPMQIRTFDITWN